MPDHTYGWWSVLPPLAAIVLAIVTRRVQLSLLCGVLIGVVLLTVFHPPTTWTDAILLPITAAEEHLWSNLSDSDHLRVFAFTLLMGAMVGVISESGGMRAVIERVAPLARGRRGGQLVTWCLGLLVFFDDYANTLLLGHTMRPLCDRLRISREKLAYLVDSTAAPVAGVAIISTWVAAEIGYIDDGLSGLPWTTPVQGFEMFIATIPYRFYVLLALAFVFLVGLMQRDFGPMWTAELRAREPSAMRQDPMDLTLDCEAGHWVSAVAPVLLMLGITLLLLVATGYQNLGAGSDPTWFTAFINGDSYLALVYGALAGLATAIVLAARFGVRQQRWLGAAVSGARSMVPALTILWLAWSLSGMTSARYLGTGTFLGGAIESAISASWLPTVVFVLAALVAFSTGTSWGTMALLTPLAARSVHAMLSVDGAAVSASEPLVLATIGSVLAGAICGDHCSPISDTTVLSSQASGCDHIAHVRTQMPYALVVAVVSIGCGTIPVGFGVPVWMTLVAGLLVLVVSLRILGRGLAAG